MSRICDERRAKALAFVFRNERVSTRQVRTELKCGQQSAWYILDSLRRRKLVTYWCGLWYSK